MAVAFGVVVGRNWDTPSALDKDVWWVFGGTFVVMSLFIGSGAIVLKIRDHYRWFGWWIGLCVAVHFAPLVWVFDDWSYLILSVVQVAGLVVMLPGSGEPSMKRADGPAPGSAARSWCSRSCLRSCSWLGTATPCDSWRLLCCDDAPCPWSARRTGVQTQKMSGHRINGVPTFPTVEVRGFEPLTFSMPWRRATNCAIPPDRLPLLGDSNNSRTWRWRMQNACGVSRITLRPRARPDARARTHDPTTPCA